MEFDVIEENLDLDDKEQSPIVFFIVLHRKISKIFALPLSKCNLKNFFKDDTNLGTLPTYNSSFKLLPNILNETIT